MRTYSRRKYYCCHQNAKYFLLKNGSFSNIAIAILDFSLLLPIQLSLFQLCDSKSCRSLSLCFNFLYEFCRLVHGSFSVLLPIQLSLLQLFHSNSCRSFTLLKALEKSNGNLFAVTFKSEEERQLSLSRQLEERYLQIESYQKRSKELIQKKDAERIKCDNFKRGNRDRMIGWHHNYFVFWWQ